MQHHFHGRIALVERAGNRAAAVAVHAQRQLRHIVRADGEAVKIFQELLGQKRVARQFAHHNQAQTVFAALQTVFFQDADDLFRLAQRAHKRNHDFHIGQPHGVAHIFQGFAFQCERVFEIVGHITRRAAEAQHRVLFVRFVQVAAHQAGVFVGFEIGHAHDGFARINRSGQCGHALGDFVHIKIGRRRITGNAFADFVLQIAVQFVEFNQRFRVDADLAVDDEFHARQADAFAWNIGERERQFGVAHVHHDFHGRFGHVVQRHFIHRYIEQALVNQAGIALGA